MMIEQFIDRLEQQGLLDPEVIGELRRKVARVKGKKITAEAVAKYLVDSGHLTRFQATRLVSNVTLLLDAAAASEKKKGGPDQEQPDGEQSDGGLTLVPEEEDRSYLSETRAVPDNVTGKKTLKSADDELEELLAIDDDRSNARKVAEKNAAGGEAKLSRWSDSDAPITVTPTEAKRKQKEEKSPRKEPPPPEPPPPPPPVVVRGESVMDELAADLEASSALASADRDSVGLRGLFGGGGRSPVQRKLQKSSEWDSMLLLVGGASLGVLLILGGFLYFSLTRGAAEDLFAAGEQAYRDESYAVSVKLYDKYLKAYPNHEKASFARVKREIARLRQVFKNPEQGLQVATEILPRIEQEEAFPQVRDELASMLPQIARAFVDQAMLSDDPSRQETLLQQTADALTLVNNTTYIPTTLRRSQLTTIAGIEEDVARVQREIDRETNLVETVQVIESAVSSGDTQLAYESRARLLSRYPGLDANESLREAVLTISEKEQEHVRVVDEPLTALADDVATMPPQSVILSHRMGQAVSGVQDHIVFVLAGESVFALDVATGDVLWRRYVGAETTTPPMPLSSGAAGADAIVVDRRRQEVMRLGARTGQLMWRLPLGEPFADPVLLEGQLFIAARSGKLHVVDVDTGNAAQHVKIPQPLEVAPGVPERRSHIYQVGEQDNLYVLSRENLQCEEVFYIGHKRGTISVPPVMALGYLFVAENAGPDFSYLHVIRANQDGLHLRTAQTKIRLQGQVVVTPLVGNRRVLVVTDRRAVELYDVELNDENSIPVRSAGRHNATAEDPIISYPLMTGGYMWVANNRFTKYQVQASTGKLPSEWVQDEQDVYVAPLQLIRDVIVHVRRRQGARGFTVAATRVNDKDASWQTEISVPSRLVAVKDATIEAVNARGRLFQLDPDAIGQGVVRQASASAMRDDRVTLALSDALAVGDSRWVLAPQSGYNQVVLYQKEGENAGLRLLTLTIPLGAAATEPTPFARGLLVPLRDGTIALSDLTAGGERAKPFHPRIEAGSSARWNRAVVLDSGREFVIANDRQRLYRVGIAEKPETHLQELGSLTMSERICGPLATFGDVIYVTTRSGTGDTLFAVTLPGLRQVQQWPLQGRVRWGPQRVGELVLTATDTELVSLDGQQQRWKVPLENVPIVGQPLMMDGQILLAAEEGTLLRVDAGSGATIASVSVGEPLSWGPIVYQDRLLVAGRCGVLHLVAIPNP